MAQASASHRRRTQCSPCRVLRTRWGRLCDAKAGSTASPARHAYATLLIVLSFRRRTGGGICDTKTHEWRYHVCIVAAPARESGVTKWHPKRRSRSLIRGLRPGRIWRIGCDAKVDSSAAFGFGMTRSGRFVMGWARIDCPRAHYAQDTGYAIVLTTFQIVTGRGTLRLRGYRLLLRSRIALPQPSWRRSLRAQWIAPSAADRSELPVLPPRTICGGRHKPIHANAARGLRVWDSSRQSSVQSYSHSH